MSGGAGGHFMLWINQFHKHFAELWQQVKFLLQPTEAYVEQSIMGGVVF